MSRPTTKKGFSLAEVLVATSIMTGFLLALISAQNVYKRLAHLAPERAKAVFLAQEGIANVRFARDESWSANIATVSAFPVETIDNRFQRVISLTALDDHRKRADVNVSWESRGATTTISLSSVIVDLYGN